MLASSEMVRTAVRTAMKKPPQARVDATLFRSWLYIPTASERILGDLPGRYAESVRKNAEHGTNLIRPTGMRAMLALNDIPIETDEQFADVLADIRSQERSLPDTDVHHYQPADRIEEPGLDDVTTALDAGGVSELYDRLLMTGDELATLLDSAAHDARAGRAVSPSLVSAVEGWHTLRRSVWKEIGVSAPTPSSGLSALARIRDEMAEREARQVADELARERKLAEYRDALEHLQEAIPALKSVVSLGDTYRDAYEKAVADRADIEAKIVAVSALPDPPSAPSTPFALEPSRVSTPEDAIAAAEEMVVVSATSAAVVVEPDLEIPVAKDSPEPAVDFVAKRPSPVADPPQEIEARTPIDTEVSVISAPSADFTSALACHVEAGRYGAAWVVAQAAGFDATHVAVYRLAAAAFQSAPGGIDPSEVLTNLTLLVTDTTFTSPQPARVALAATLRAALAAGWIPRSEVEALFRQAGLNEHWRALQVAVIEAVDRHYQHLQGFRTSFAPTIDEVRERARVEREQLNKLRTKFVRADKVLMYLLRSQEPLGAALSAVEADTSGDERRSQLTAALAALQAPEGLIATADAKVSTPQQRRREEIIKGARATLDKAIESVSHLVNEALNALVVASGDARAVLTQEAHAKLIASATVLQDNDVTDPIGPGDFALLGLVRWIRDPRKPEYTRELEILRDESLPAVSASRNEAGLPTVEVAVADDIVAELAEPLTAAELYRVYIDRGDLQQAAASARGHTDLLNRIGEHRERWTRTLRAEVAALRAEIGRTYADEFSEGDHTYAEGLLVEPESYTGDRFDLQTVTLDGLRAALAAHREQSASRLRRRVTDKITRAADRDRIVDLVDAGDLVAANELFSLALTEPLPTIVDADTTESTVGTAVFADFIEALTVCEQARGGTIRDVVQQMTIADAARGDLARLNSWDHLSSKRLPGRERQTNISSVLGEIGLDIRGEITTVPRPGSNYTCYRVTATPADGSLVPGLGSQTTYYTILVTKDPNVLLRQALVSALPDNNGPNVVLFDGLLNIEQRRQCLNVCRANQTSAIVIDHAVAAYVALRHRRSFKAVQQLTLPFTCFTHYTLVSGHVPDEVFVGRDLEQRRLTARDGSLFVYGGRQLGKTALLKRTAREFNAVDDQHAIYIDLNVHGIGRWAESQQLWQVLYNELVKLGSMQLRQNPNVRTPEPVKRAITAWLAGKETRRLLVLLDEADAFLEKESVPGVTGFRNIQPLKGLFEESSGRFKPVFAGLHRVQRLQNVANTPLAHGGSDVHIGPLAARPAHDLVAKPLAALGYRFDNPDLVWRLLAFTNMQPGLIQLVCDQLVTHMQGRPLRKGEPLIAISSEVRFPRLVGGRGYQVPAGTG